MMFGVSNKVKDDLLVDWEIFCFIGLKLVFYVVCVIGNIKNLFSFLFECGMVRIYFISR